MLTHSIRTPMISTLFCLSGLFAISTVVTLIAVVRAKDGFEDERGFHAASRTACEQASNGQTQGQTAPLPTCTGAT